MPIKFAAYADKQLLVTRYFGLVGDDDLLSTYERVFRDPSLRPGFSELGLHLQSEVLDLSRQALTEFAEMATRYHSSGEGSVSAATVHVVGKLRQELILDFYSNILELQPGSPESLKVFSNVDDALEQLGLERGDLPEENLEDFVFDHDLSVDAEHLSKIRRLIDDDVISIISRNRQLVELASTDSLTRLLNRAGLESSIEYELSRFRRYQRAAVLAMIDIDDFKRVNDRHGHPAGDHVLISIARKLRYQLRELDKAGRWGGDEFMVLLPETDLKSAHLLLDKIRRDIQAQEFIPDEHITVSIGLAAFGADIDLQELYRNVDVALYQAKATGKNRIVVFD